MYRLFFVFLLLCQFTFAQDADYIKSIEAYQEKLNEEYRDPSTSPLDKKDRKKFDHHNFYPINKDFVVEAKFIPSHNQPVFKMPATGPIMNEYRKFGELHFKIRGESFTLNAYQNMKLKETEEYKNYLFLPFTDLTNGEETYHTGRYIDFNIPETNTVTIDFNKAYNPYCAYSDRYSCPIPPVENDLNIAIEAGIKYDAH